MSLASEIQRRRTFAIISHPDAGKTTLTEKLLLFGGAILALLELYNINEQDFIEVWQGTREIAPPKPEHRARKASR
jgi:hypothetical protein